MELDTQIDWVMKRALIESFIERKSVDWQSPQVRMLDLQYHDLRPDKGLYYILERQGRAERIVTDEEIVTAIHEPPHDTRAYFRGECLKRYGTAVFGVNWDSISFGVDDEPIRRILMAEPLKGTRGHVEELLNDSPTAADLVKKLRA
jgi:proteasome accessory factor A